ncbi:hypothetical protein [Comamonas odontotermitis]|uniref:hypothetical protein n=1 Tax=Comamonas odontotermitis TaxID=379895 RepID=UPI001CC5B704|nr:hypothetical protein [Comamonas odontotermitis]UBB15428.1 hypothetical protein LAD35_11135 [Comamonas odontotermitis]
MGDKVARGLGLGVRSLAQGLASVPGMVTDNLIAKPLNAAVDAVMGEGNGPRLQMLKEATGNLATHAGLPQPETASERIAQDVAEGGAGALAGVFGAGPLLAKSAGSVAQGVGGMLMEAPKLQAVSGAASGAASGITRENGGGEVAQMVAGLAGGLAPTVGSFAGKAALRGAVRGGEAGRQQMADNIDTFEKAAGITPTLGQATQSRAIQAAETGLSSVPGSSGFMARRGEIQAKALQDAVDDITNKLAPNANGWGAGEAIAKGVDTFKNNVKTVQKNLYGKLDEFIPAQTPVQVDRTRDALAALNEGIAGAPSLSRFFKNSKIGSIEQAFLKDLDSFAQGRVNPGMQGMGVAPQPGQLPYQAVQKLRTMVGQEIADNSLVADVPRSKWRALYSALSDDLGGAAEQVGPKAQQAWSRANQYTKSSIQRLEQLEGIVNRDAPEKIFKAATSGLADGGTQIQRLMKSMPDENRREVTAAVLQRLGRARNSAQDEMGSAFSPETFLTNLAAMSAPARNALFANSGMPGLRQRIETMGRMASLRRDGAQVFANPSGTARQTSLIGMGSGLAGAIASGNIPMLMGIAATPVLGRGLASVMTNPGFVKSAAQRTQLNPATPAIALNAATQSAQSEQPVYSRRLDAEMAGLRQRKKVVQVPGGWAVASR